MPSGVYQHKKGHKRPDSVERMKGNQFAKGNKPNQTAFKKGIIPWNKNTKGIMKAWNKGKEGWTKGTKAGFQKDNDYGKGDKNWNWQGGITPINQKIRNSIKFKQWRSDVFTRDNFTCQTCKKTGGIELNAHHIKSFSKYPELRFELSNGITLCKECHKLTETYLNRWKK